MAELKLGKYNRTKLAETHKCVWCGVRDEADEFEYELGFDGWLCKQCISYLQSRGETLAVMKGARY